VAHCSGSEPRVLDDGSISKQSGSFLLYGCDNSPQAKPELHVYHVCKGTAITRVKFAVPPNAWDKEYHYTELIKLNGTYQSEQVADAYPQLGHGCVQ